MSSDTNPLRKRILQIISASHYPLTVDELAEELKTSKDRVFNTLRYLEQEQAIEYRAGRIHRLKVR